MNHQDREAILAADGERGDVPLDFDAWADLSARLLQRDRDTRLDILEAQGIEVDTWNACDQNWSLYLAAEISGGRMDQARAYGLKCAEELARRAAERPAAPATPVMAGRAAEGIGKTAPPIEMPLPAGAGDPLPFQGSPSPEFLASLVAPSTAASPDPGAGLTAPLGTNLVSQLKDTLPFGKPAHPSMPASWPRLTLQQYASLCAELSVLPHHQTEILRKYHILGDAARKAVDREWQQRLAAHADTQTEWQRLYSEFRDWLLRKPK